MDPTHPRQQQISRFFNVLNQLPEFDRDLFLMALAAVPEGPERNEWCRTNAEILEAYVNGTLEWDIDSEGPPEITTD